MLFSVVKLPLKRSIRLWGAARILWWKAVGLG